MFSMSNGMIYRRPLLATNPDDNMTSWAVVLPVVVKAGAFTGTFQAPMGRTPVTALSPVGGLLALQSTFQGYRRALNGAIKNSTGWNGFFDLAFTAGAVTPHFYMGYDYARKRRLCGLRQEQRPFDVSVWASTGRSPTASTSFRNSPTITMARTRSTPKNPDLGTEWLGGVQFQFVF